ncbi:MAG: DUF4231 domain-containing protein [Halobacteriota archaeon]
MFGKKDTERNISPDDAISKLADTYLKTESGKELENLRAYVKTRIAPGVLWYQKEGDRAENTYLAMQITAVVLGALVPVLVNVSIPSINLNNLVTLLSLIVVIVIALEGVLHYREHYRNYRSTAHALEQECFSCFLRAPPYDSCDDKELCSRFVENAEDLMGQEGSTNIKNMTISSDYNS